MKLEDMELGSFYALKDGHKRQNRKHVNRRAFRYEGEAPGPQPTGWFIDLEANSFHAFRLDDMVESQATAIGTKGRTVSGRRKRRHRTEGAKRKAASRS